MRAPLIILIISAIVSICPAATPAKRPNVVIIYGDDVGLGDVGVYGSKMIPTPNIDRLASQGLRFTDGHCAAGTCTPSRFSLMTGLYGFRKGVRVLSPNAPLCIPLDVVTLPQVFKRAGYTTAIIGKWHLGIGDGKTPVDWNGDVKPGPLEVGFDFSFLLPSTNDRVPCIYLLNHRVLNLDPNDPITVGRNPLPNATIYPNGRANPEAMTYYKSSHGHNNSVINGIGRIGSMSGGKSALWNDETMADVFVEQMRTYVEKHKDESFFLFFSSQDIHVPRTPHPRFKGKSQLGYRGDAMVQFDWTTGEILKTLDEHGVADNTIVIFSSDNGPVYDDGYEDGTTVRTSQGSNDRGHYGAGPYRGGKYQIYEGGTRVPFIVRWPGKITPGTSDALVNQIDFLASFAALLDVPLDENDAPDSRDIMDALLGKDKVGLPYMVEEAGKRALRKGPWKYIPPRNGKKKKAGNAAGELYNLDRDVAESKNVIAEFPEVSASMDTTLKTIISEGRTR